MKQCSHSNCPLKAIECHRLDAKEVFLFCSDHASKNGFCALCGLQKLQRTHVVCYKCDMQITAKLKPKPIRNAG